MVVWLVRIQNTPNVTDVDRFRASVVVEFPNDLNIGKFFPTPTLSCERLVEGIDYYSPTHQIFEVGSRRLILVHPLARPDTSRPVVQDDVGLQAGRCFSALDVPNQDELRRSAQYNIKLGATKHTFPSS